MNMYLIVAALVAAVAVGFGGGWLALRGVARWCPSCGAGLTCPDCTSWRRNDRGPNPLAGAGSRNGRRYW